MSNLPFINTLKFVFFKLYVLVDKMQVGIDIKYRF